MTLLRETDAYTGIGAIAIARSRSKEARFLSRIRAMLIAHIGTPNALQSILIERTAMTLLRLERMDAISLKDVDAANRQAADYRQLQNFAATLLARLGLESMAVQPAPAGDWKPAA